MAKGERTAATDTGDSRPSGTSKASPRPSQSDRRGGSVGAVRSPLAVWLAWSRSVQSWKSSGSPTDHATTDGVTSLCGIKQIGGYDRNAPFDSGSVWSCRRCRAALVKGGR